MNNLSSIPYFLPEFSIIIIALSILVFDLVGLKKYIKLFSIIGFLFIGLLLLQSSSSGVFIFENMLVNDSLSYYFKWIILISTFSIFLVSNYSKELDDEYYSEYNFLLMVILLGMFLMTNSIDLLMIYLSVELVSIPSYILAGMIKSDKESNEASLKYVIFGSFASGLMLFGLSILYGIVGTTDIMVISQVLQKIEYPLSIFFPLVLILSGVLDELFF